MIEKNNTTTVSPVQRYRLIGVSSEVRDFQIADYAQCDVRVEILLKYKPDDKREQEEPPSYIVEMRVYASNPPAQDSKDDSDSIVAAVTCSYLAYAHEGVLPSEVVQFLWPMLRTTLIGQASQIGLLLGERLPVTPPPGAEQLNGTEDEA